MQISTLEYLERTVSLFPEKIAIIDKYGSLSFKELQLFSKKVASSIINQNIQKQPIVVLIPKDRNSIISFLGINYSGNFYIPVDINSPTSRINNILQTLKAKVIITTKELKPKFEDIHIETIFTIDELIDKSIEIKEINYPKIIDTDPVYSIFTSGSTGIPKGVTISYKSVVDYIDWAIDTFEISSEEVIGNQAPFYFDNSVLDIYLMLSTGASLVLVPESMYAFPAKLIDYMNEHKVNFVFWVPFVLMHIANLDIFKQKKLLYIKKVLFAGEVMPNKHLNYWRKHYPDCLYANLYGPTEITVDCTYYIVKRNFDDNEVLPIGFPCRNSDVLILDEQDRLADNGKTGELCVRGSSLALGYYGNWEKTQNAFVQNPLNPHYPELIYKTGDLAYKNEYDEIIFVGRKDSQIKHNGYRIELGEIENAALATNLIKTTCATYDNQNKRIVLFYEGDTEVSLSEMRQKMLKIIPKYMIPSTFKKIEKMPLNSSGKVDRKFLNTLVCS